MVKSRATRVSRVRNVSRPQEGRAHVAGGSHHRDGQLLPVAVLRHENPLVPDCRLDIEPLPRNLTLIVGEQDLMPISFSVSTVTFTHQHTNTRNSIDDIIGLMLGSCWVAATEPSVIK